MGGVLKTICLGYPGTKILSISASKVARITSIAMREILWPQRYLFVRQALYPLSNSTSPVFYWVFLRYGLTDYLLGLVLEP
jgi:hypothetical protein